MPSAVLRYAPIAAERAAALGAHREAVDLYSRALRFAKGLAPRPLAELLEWGVGRSREGLESAAAAVSMPEAGEPGSALAAACSWLGIS